MEENKYQGQACFPLTTINPNPMGILTGNLPQSSKFMHCVAFKQHILHIKQNWDMKSPCKEKETALYPFKLMISSPSGRKLVSTVCMLSAFLSPYDDKINRHSRAGFEPKTSCLLVQMSSQTQPPSLLVASGRFES